MAIDIIDAGRQARDVALSLWGRHIVDPPRSTWRDPAWDASRYAIDDMIRGPMGLGWSRCSSAPPIKAYRHDGDYEWCGAFAAQCWRAVGLAPELARLYWSSTYRLDRYGSRRTAFWTPGEARTRKAYPGADRAYLQVRPETTLEDVERWGPRAGDILLVDTVSGWDYGHHVTIVGRVEGVVAHTIEGNATGRAPSGDVVQGVVRQTRHMRTWRRFIRPGASDLVAVTP